MKGVGDGKGNGLMRCAVQVRCWGDWNAETWEEDGGCYCCCGRRGGGREGGGEVS